MAVSYTHLDVYKRQGHHDLHDFAAQILELIGGRNGEVAFLVARPIAKVRAFLAGIPAAFVGIDEIITVLVVGIEAHAIEDEKFGFGAEEMCIRDRWTIGFGADGIWSDDFDARRRNGGRAGDAA